jgi:hypothetical protein
LSYAPYVLVLIRNLVSRSPNTQKLVADDIEKARELRKNAKECDYPECRVKKQDKTLFKCDGCQVATYCCYDHSVLHWPVHMGLCKELRRRCDHPECNRLADMEIRCGKCNMATYCSEEHRSEHRAAHRSVCKQLRA